MLLSLFLLALADIPPAPRPAPAPAPAPAAPAAVAAEHELRLPTPVESKMSNGLAFSADLREEYLAGMPLLVELAVRNTGTAPQTFPDLSARPFLVHFRLTTPKGQRQDRFNTPPAQDPGTTWTIAPGASRRVLLEVPLSSNFDPGAWTLGVEVQDGSGAVLTAIAGKSIRLSVPSHKTGRFTWDPTLNSGVGAAMTWLHGGSGGYDLYLSQFDSKRPTRLLSHSYLGRLQSYVDPHLSRTRSSDANSRYVYWRKGASISYVRLDGSSVRTRSTFSLPYPRFSLLDEGVTGSDGALLVPLWIPAPSGEGGSVKVLELDPRATGALRQVVDLPAPPSKVATSLDASGNLLFAMAHSGGLDIYRVDPTWDNDLPARGSRALKGAEMPVTWLGWDVLPDQGEKAGGLTLCALLIGSAESGPTYRYLNADLGGKLVRDSGVLPWLMPGAVLDVLPRALEPFRALVRDGEGALWYGMQGSTPAKLGGKAAGVLFTDSEGTKLRVLGTGLYTDTLLGP